ncbi:NYN domain-containing protein [Desulfitobacterium hafniense]|uniref:NYN domain-containing protein n=1 Tax=Desulfitobacterium hafniense TaxID=49338 RepID=UPI00035F391A|nr:NYN domain-containing protein [Desulfitobacterium hafniense]
MLRGMIFVDHMNFDIALQQYYIALGQKTPKLDYNLFFRELTAKIPNVDFTKAFIFVPKPDNFLMQDVRLANYYNWVIGMRNAPFIDVIEGSYVARPISDTIPMSINDELTYYKIEKGTDINLAVHAINKAFYNSYDIGFFLSADTDYLTVYEVLKNIGKLTVAVAVKGQNIGKIIPNVDKHIILDDTFFRRCLRQSKT